MSHAGASDAPDTESLMAEAVIDEQMMANMRELIGIKLRIDHSVNNEEATRLAVARFAAGIGDTNPLWLDADYANASPYRGLVAPPSWPIAAFSGIQFGWPGLGAFHSESTLEFHRPVYLGDRVTAQCVYDGFSGPQPSIFAGRTVVDRFTNTYENQRGELVAVIQWSVINFERGAAKERMIEFGHSVPHQWTIEELEEIEAQVLAEKPRGAEPRWWEDVRVGDSLSELIKGPIGITDAVAFLVGGGAPIPRLAAHRAALQGYSAHPAWTFRDPTSFALEPIYAVHYNQHAARSMGVPLQYDVGFQRQCWHTHLLTDWMGDDAWLVRSSAQYRGFVYHGDVVRLGGAVVAKRVEGDDCVVDVRTWARNQREHDVMPGTATIALPTRTAELSPAARFARADESLSQVSPTTSGSTAGDA